MDFKTFDELVERETKRMRDVMCSKSADYSADDDKLFNFKLAAEVDGISPIEALRGMRLKHQTSIRQGLDELMNGKCRPEAWWIEKLTDDRNYSILLQALLTEKYFVNEPEEVNEFTIVKARNANKGWYIILTKSKKGCYPEFLHKDHKLHFCTGWDGSYAYGYAPGYYDNKEHAKSYIRMYKSKPFVCPAGWEIELVEPADGKYDCGWIVKNEGSRQLWKNLTLHSQDTGWKNHNYGEAPGYWPTKEDAEAALVAYLGKNNG